LDAVAGGEDAVSDQDAVGNKTRWAMECGRNPTPSLPGLTRQSIASEKGFLRSWMDARIKPAHDEFWMPPQVAKTQ
jgi:hypothetical protein